MNTELQQVVEQLEDVVKCATDKSQMSESNIRHILSFISKVAHVVDQAFQDVYTTLVEIKCLREEEYELRIAEIEKSLHMILARSRYREAEEICSRLHHLRTQYEEQIAPLLGSIGNPDKWRELFWLVQEREGRIITLVDHTVDELVSMVEKRDVARLPAIRKKAAKMVEAVRKSLSELRELTNRILGLSGQPGFLELTGDRQTLSKQTKLLINKGPISMTRDIYSAGQAGAMGPGAHAENMTFQQMWNQQGKSIDLPSLARELGSLRAAMRNEASTAEHDISIGNVAAAESAAQKGDGPSALKFLKESGKWTFDVATRIGVGVATAAIKGALGI